MNTNTKIFYEYRDAGGWSQHQTVVLAGKLTPNDAQRIERLLDGGMFFIAADFGLEELQSRMAGYPTDDDHIWHTWNGFVLTEEEPTVELTTEAFMQRVQQVEANGWNEEAAFHRHGFVLW